MEGTLIAPDTSGRVDLDELVAGARPRPSGRVRAHPGAGAALRRGRRSARLPDRHGPFAGVAGPQRPAGRRDRTRANRPAIDRRPIGHDRRGEPRRASRWFDLSVRERTGRSCAAVFVVGRGMRRLERRFRCGVVGGGRPWAGHRQVQRLRRVSRLRTDRVASAPPGSACTARTVELEDGTTVTADDDYLTRAIADPGADIVDGLHGDHAQQRALRRRDRRRDRLHPRPVDAPPRRAGPST